MKKVITFGMAIAASTLLQGCGGGGGSDTVGRLGSTGEITLHVMDAPVDGATSVNITITAVELKSTGTPKRVTLAGNGLRLNLMDYNGQTTLPLFTETVTSGEYQWARFELKNDATICFGESNCSNLEIPNSQEIKTSRTFSVPANGVVEYVVDWDLRKSIVDTGSKYQLKPVLHLRPYSSDGESSVGYIEGTINGTRLSGCASPAVYLFSQNGTIEDIQPGDDVLASVLVPNSGEDNAGHFYLGALEPATYRLAFTCDAANDDVTQNDDNVTFDIDVLQVTVPSGGGATFNSTYPFEPVSTL